MHKKVKTLKDLQNESIKMKQTLEDALTHYQVEVTQKEQEIRIEGDNPIFFVDVHDKKEKLLVCGIGFSIDRKSNKKRYEMATLNPLQQHDELGSHKDLRIETLEEALFNVIEFVQGYKAKTPDVTPRWN